MGWGAGGRWCEQGQGSWPGSSSATYHCPARALHRMELPSRALPRPTPTLPIPPCCTHFPPSGRYTSDETPMGQYVSIHDVLDARRQEALKAKGEGPRTFVVGPTGGAGARVGQGAAHAPAEGRKGRRLCMKCDTLHAAGVHRCTRTPEHLRTRWPPPCLAWHLPPRCCPLCPAARRPAVSRRCCRCPPAPQTWARARCARSFSTMRCAPAGRPPLRTWTLGRAASPCPAA